MSHFIDDHVVICNWNNRGERLIEILWALRTQTHRAERSIVILADGIDRLPDTASFHNTLVIPVSPLAPHAFRRAKVGLAEAVILLADRRQASPDDATMLTALRLERELHSLHDAWVQTQRRGHAAGDPPRWPNVAAEVVDPARRRHLETAGVHETVCATDTMYRVVAQAMLTPMILPVFRDLIRSSEDTNEVYLVDVPPPIVGRSFTDALAYFADPSLRGRGISALPVGYKPGAREGTRERPVDRDLVLNPRGEALARPLEATDQLVVIDYDQTKPPSARDWPPFDPRPTKGSGVS